jgi:hypothetical protein
MDFEQLRDFPDRQDEPPTERVARQLQKGMKLLVKLMQVQCVQSVPRQMPWMCGTQFPARLGAWIGFPDVIPAPA